MISNNRRNLAALCLERAKAPPLESHLYTGQTRRNPQFLDLLAPHFQNTEILRIYDASTIRDLSVFSRHPMINLRSLALSNEVERDWNRSIDPFESSTYTLRYLELVQAPLFPSFLDLKTLTGLNFWNSRCNIHLDTLLDFLEENRSPMSVKLNVRFTKPSLRSSRRRAPIQNRLQYLRISGDNAKDGQALISGIALSKSAELELDYEYSGARVGVGAILSGISTTHLLNLSSPTSMRYHVRPRIIELRGPNGTVSFYGNLDPDLPFVEFPLLPLATIRQFHLDACGWYPGQPSPGPVAFHISSFTALETFVAYDTNSSDLFSALLSNPSAPPSLKTLAFWNCFLSEEFMRALTRFASDHKNTTSARLQRVVIIHWGGMFPTIASIRKLEEHVPLVDVRTDTKLPTDV